MNTYQAKMRRKGHIPLPIEGRYKNHILAFARHYEQTWYVIALPLGMAQLCGKQTDDILALDWQDTRIVLPAEASSTWQHCLINRKGNVENGIAAADLFNDLPLAVLNLENHP